MSQVSRRPEVGNHERRTPNTRLSSGTSEETFAVSAGPYINYCAETGTKNELGMFFEPVQKRLEGLPAIRDVGCAHPGFASYLASIRCPKVRSVHPSKWPFWLRATVPKKTLACIGLRNDPCMHPFSESLKTNVWIRTSKTLVFISIIQPLSMKGYPIDRNHSSCNLNPNRVGGLGHPLL